MSRKTVKAQRRSRRKMSKKQRGGKEGFIERCMGAFCGSRLTPEEGKAVDAWNKKAEDVERSIAAIDGLLHPLCLGFNNSKKTEHLKTLVNLTRQALTLETGPYKELLAKYANMSDKVQSVLERKHHSIKTKMSYLLHHAIPAVDLRCSGFDTQGSS